MYLWVAHEMSPCVPEDYPRSQEELARVTYLYRRSDAFAALRTWFLCTLSLDQEKIRQRHDKDIVELPESRLCFEAQSSLKELVQQFENLSGSLRQDLCFYFDDASSELSMENYEQIIDDFSVRMKTFAQTVVRLAVNKLEEGMKIIEDFQTEHRGHQQYKCSLSFLMLVHSHCHRKITDRVSCIVNGYDINFEQYLERWEPELKRKARQRMKEAGLKSLLRC